MVQGIIRLFSYCVLVVVVVVVMVVVMMVIVMVVVQSYKVSVIKDIYV